MGDNQCSRLGFGSLDNRPGRLDAKKKGQQAHPATAGASKRHRGRASLSADGDLSGQGLQRMQRPLPHLAAGLAVQLPLSSRAVSKSGRTDQFPDNAPTKQGLRASKCCQEGKGLFWGPLDISPERAALARFT